MCLCWLLKSQDKQIWDNDQTIKCYLTILNFVIHEKPKIRKCGQEAVRLIINSCNSNESAEIYKFVSSLTADYCLELITNTNEDSEEENETSKQDTKASNENKEKAKKNSYTQRVLHTLGLIKHIIHHFDIKHLKNIGECLLRLMTLKDLVNSFFNQMQFLDINFLKEII